MAPLSILIVGCGCAGPVLASFLLLAPDTRPEDLPHITIVERAGAHRAAGQNIDIRGTGATLIRKLGVEQKIRAATTGEEGMQIVDDQNQVWVSAPADKTGRVQTATSDIEILRGTLVDILTKRSEQISDGVKARGGRGIDYVNGDYVEELDQDGAKVHVRFAKSGERRSYDVVVGADGLQSRTRRQAFGDEGDAQRLKYLSTIAAFYSMPAAATDSLWRRWWHGENRRSITVRPSGQEGRSTVVLLLVHPDERATAVAKLGPKGAPQQKALLKKYFDHGEWECDRVMREMEAADDFYYDLVAQVKMEKWHKGRVVLLGDAGCCAAPISGMGTTLALNGAYNLAGALTHHPDDPNAAFDAFETAMRPLVDVAQKLPPGNPELFHWKTSWGIWIMRWAFRAIFSSGIGTLAEKFMGPPADVVGVKEYGFRQPEEMQVDV